MASFFRFYQSSFDSRPYTTLICANAALNALADAVAQFFQMTLVIRNSDSMQMPHTIYDPMRTFRFAIFGAAMGPVIGRWFKFLEHRFPLRSAGGKASLVAVVKRVASDQIFMAPLGLVVFFGSMGMMEGRTSAEIIQKYTDVYAAALLANWTIWPFAQMVNFWFMPLAFRVPFQSTCGFEVSLAWVLTTKVDSENKSMEQD